MSNLTGQERFLQDFEQAGSDYDYFVSSKLLDGIPATWADDSLNYTMWRHTVAAYLGVNPLSVLVVGSARLGYSLNPEKNFKLFDQMSDIDVAIVSSEYFEKAWDEIRVLFENGTLPSDKIGYYRKLIVDRCIPTESILPLLSFGIKWSKNKDKITEKLGKQFYNNTVEYRVYRDHQALIDYQRNSIKNAYIIATAPQVEK